MFDFGDKVITTYLYIEMYKLGCYRHKKFFYGKPGKIASKKFTSKYRINNRPASDSYVILFKKDLFTNEEISEAQKNVGRVFIDDEGEEVIVSNYVWRKDELLAYSSRKFVQCELKRLAQI